MRSRGRSEKRAFIILAVVIFVILGAAIYAFAISQGPSQNTPVGTHVYTWSVKMTIQIFNPDNTSITIPIPSHIGQSVGIWADHTWDDYGTSGVTAPVFTIPSLNDSSLYDGHIYISPTRYGHAFTISDFFNIWGEKITDTCMQIPNYPMLCTGSQGRLYAEVNTLGIISISTHAFLNQEDIVIMYFRS